jgi:hypothetical protein
LAWITHFSWRDASEKKEEEYRAFADHHWTYARWNDQAWADSADCQSIPVTETYADLNAAIQGLQEANPSLITRRLAIVTIPARLG